MKKLFISAMAMCAALTSMAQLVDVVSVNKIPLPADLNVGIPTISPDGSFAVVSDAGSTALRRVDLATGKVTLVTPNGNGNNVAISADGTQVVFRRTVTAADKRRLNSLESVDLSTGKETQLVAATRRLNPAVSFKGNSVTAVADGKARAKGLGGAKASRSVVVSTNYGHLDVNIDGKSHFIDPQGPGSYLWPSLSPDGTRIVYYVASHGCFVCNLDGSNPVALGVLRAPQWLGNDKVVGMRDQDDGKLLTSSAIIASDLKGTRQTLTDSSVIAIYPSVSADASKIAFSTAEGELYVINLK